jgi:AraC-like DNA-binding protein
MHRHVFSTSGFRLEERFDAWRARDWPSLAPAMDCTPPECSFSAEVETIVAAGVPIIFSEMSGFFFARGTARLRSDGLDHYGLLISRDIRFRGEGAGRGFAGGPGQLLVGDFARPIEQSSTDGAAISLALPRELADAAIPMMSVMHGRVVDASRVGLLADFLLSVRARVPQIAPSDEPVIGGMLLDLIKMALGYEEVPRRASAPISGETRMWVVRRLIDAELDASDLGPEYLSRALGMSRSTLYRIFEPLGGVAAFIKQRRLERAATLLIRPGPPARMHEIARACGFREQASFSRAFRQRHGLTPTEFRHANTPLAPLRGSLDQSENR